MSGWEGGAGLGAGRRLGFGLFLVLDAVLPAEALDPARGVHELLLAREEGMAVRADFHVHGVLHGRACLDHVAADAHDLGVVVARVNPSFHLSAPYVFIIARNFLFVLVWLILPIKNSMA